MSADPKAPQAGDRFTADYRARGEVAEVRFVDVDGAVAYRYVEPTPSTGGGFMCSADEFAAHFQPAPEPLITEPLRLWRQTFNGQHDWSFTPCWGDGTCITIMPDGTWFEGQPPCQTLQGEQ